MKKAIMEFRNISFQDTDARYHHRRSVNVSRNYLNAMDTYNWSIRKYHHTFLDRSCSRWIKSKSSIRFTELSLTRSDRTFYAKSYAQRLLHMYRSNPFIGVEGMQLWVENDGSFIDWSEIFSFTKRELTFQSDNVQKLQCNFQYPRNRYRWRRIHSAVSNEVDVEKLRDCGRHVSHMIKIDFKKCPNLSLIIGYLLIHVAPVSTQKNITSYRCQSIIFAFDMFANFEKRYFWIIWCDETHWDMSVIFSLSTEWLYLYIEEEQFSIASQRWFTDFSVSMQNEIHIHIYIFIL